MRSPWSLPFSPPWRDRRGRFLPFKSAVLASLVVPGALYAYWLATDQLGGRQVMELIHGAGLITGSYDIPAASLRARIRKLDFGWRFCWPPHRAG